MKNKITLGAIAIITLSFVMVVSWNSKNDIAYDPIRFYNRNGQVLKAMRVFTDTITPSTANGYSLDISAAGFNTILSVNAIAVRNTATSTSVANVGVKTMSTTAVVFNSTEGNGSLINILGSNVLLGPSTAFAATSGLQLSVTIIGY